MAITINVNLDDILQALKDDLDFTGNADKYIKVNATADGFEFSAVSTSVSWGEILGTLSDQTDLQNALNLKANLSGAAFTGGVSVTTSGSGTTFNLTNSGSGTTLNIDNSGSGDFFVIDTDKLVVSNNGNLAVDTDTLFVDSVNDRVGVGTSSPSYPLHVYNSSGVINIASFRSSANNERVWVGAGAYIESKGSEQRITLASTGTAGKFTVYLTNSEKLRILNNGRFGFNTTSPQAQSHLVVTSSANVGQIIQAAAGQTANLQEWRNSGGGVLASIGSDGKLSIGISGGLRYTPSATRYTDSTGLNLGGGLYMSFPNTASDAFISYIGGGAKSNIYMYCRSDGRIGSRSTMLLGAADGDAAVAGATASAQLEIRSTTRGFLPPVMTGAQVEAISSPAEGLIEYATDAGSTDVTSKGLYVYDGSNFGKLITSINGNVNLTSPTTSSIPLSVKAAAGQTANTFEIRDSASNLELYHSIGNGLFVQNYSSGSTIFAGNARGSGTVAFELQNLSLRRFRILSTATQTTFESSNQSGGFVFNKAITPASLADSAAQVNSIYYSTDQNKLVYKDAGGVVNDLY
jgi:hypothetical protein